MKSRPCARYMGWFEMAWSSTMSTKLTPCVQGEIGYKVPS